MRKRTDSTTFVSYSHVDKIWVREELLRRLDAWKIRVLVDFRSFKPGEHLASAIQNAIDGADHVVFVIS